jgi:hypothetical protein
VAIANLIDALAGAYIMGRKKRDCIGYCARLTAVMIIELQSDAFIDNFRAREFCNLTGRMESKAILQFATGRMGSKTIRM